MPMSLPPSKKFYDIKQDIMGKRTDKKTKKQKRRDHLLWSLYTRYTR